MKKILSGILCLAMVLSMAVPSFAADNDMTIRYSNQESYEISIPASMDLDASSGEGMFTIEVDETEMSEDSYVSVTATSKNYDGGWFLVNVNDKNDKIEYFIGTTDNGSDVSANNEIMAADGNTSIDFYIRLSDTSKFGTYEDTITFSSEVKRHPIGYLYGDHYLPEINYNQNEYPYAMIAINEDGGIPVFVASNKPLLFYAQYHLLLEIEPDIKIMAQLLSYDSVNGLYYVSDTDEPDYIYLSDEDIQKMLEEWPFETNNLRIGIDFAGNLSVAAGGLGMQWNWLFNERSWSNYDIVEYDAETQKVTGIYLEAQELVPIYSGQNVTLVGNKWVIS